jgi:hypothetical protein
LWRTQFESDEAQYEVVDQAYNEIDALKVKLETIQQQVDILRNCVHEMGSNVPWNEVHIVNEAYDALDVIAKQFRENKNETSDSN